MNTCDRKEIYNLPGNEACFDCGSPHPTWTSLSHGTLICMKCSGLHRGMGVHISFVRSLDLDTFSEQDVKQLLFGGNQTCRDFFAKHGVVFDSGMGRGNSSSSSCISSSTDALSSTTDRGCYLLEKYDSSVAKLYRETLKARVHGRPEPSMQDIQVESQRKDKIGTYAGNDNLTYKKINFEESTACNSMRKLSNVEYFIGALKYWTNRYILLPTSNNRTFCGLLLVMYISTKIVFKTSKVSEPSSNSSNPIIYAINSLLFLMFTSVSAIILLSSCLSIQWFQVHRQDAFKSAKNSFQDRVNHARAKRNVLYDLYFPPKISVKSDVSKAIIFFPDILVDKTAYSFVLGKISDCGILVAAVNLDPMRLSGVITNKTSPSNIVSQIGFEIHQLLGIKVEELILMSHGEGACAVSHAMKVLSAKNTSRRFLPHPTRCIFCSPTSFMYDLTNLNISALVIRAVESSKATCDGCHDEWIHRRIPRKRVRICNVVGGSHSGFGHYGPATFRKDNLTRIKSLDDQQNEVRDIIVDFILKG